MRDRRPSIVSMLLKCKDTASYESKRHLHPCIPASLHPCIPNVADFPSSQGDAAIRTIFPHWRRGCSGMVSTKGLSCGQFSTRKKGGDVLNVASCSSQSKDLDTGLQRASTVSASRIPHLKAIPEREKSPPAKNGSNISSLKTSTFI